MATEWKSLGAVASNNEVLSLLNNEGIGRVAAVSVNAARSLFSVWGDDDNDTIVQGYTWKVLGETGSDSAANKLLQDNQAAGGAISVNMQGQWVVWGYVG